MATLQCFCLENPTHRGAWQATVPGVAESDTTEATEHAHIVTSVPRPGTEPEPLQGKRQVLTAGPPGTPKHAQVLRARECKAHLFTSHKDCLPHTMLHSDIAGYEDEIRKEKKGIESDAAYFVHCGLSRSNSNPLQSSCLETPMDGGAWWAEAHVVMNSQTQLRDFTFTFHFQALEKEIATHSSVLAWRIPGNGERGGLPSVGLCRVRHD